MKIEKRDIQGFLFDLDGVIIDSEREYTRIWEKIGLEFPTGIENFAYKIKGTTLEDILAKYYPDVEVRDRVRERLYEEEAAMKYQYCAGAEALLKRLKSEGVPTALYTSSDSYKMSHLYRDIPEIRDYFNVIITGDNVTRSKPDPQGYLMAAEAIGVPIEDCAVVEDSLQGVKAGRASGAFVIGVANTLPEDVLLPYSDIIVDNLSKL